MVSDTLEFGAYRDSRRLSVRAASALASSLALLLTVTPYISAQIVPGFCRAYPPKPAPGQWQSSRVFYFAGRLTYATDAEGNRIPDYSYAGYRHGEFPIPTARAVLRIASEPGDNTARVQRALDEVGARRPDANGIRGAVVLAPGVYEIRGTLRVDKGGVVLRGSGDGGDPSHSSILRATGDTPRQRSVIVAGSGDSSWPETATRSDITTPVVRVGAASFDVQSAKGFAVGDNIVIRHPSTESWINAVEGGGVVKKARWTPGQLDIVYNRRITRIARDTITVDAPVYNHLDRSLSQSYIARTAPRHVTKVGVESLRIDIVTAGAEDENHAWNGVSMIGAQDSWVRGVTALHFGYAGVRLEGAVRVTVENCRALDPVGVRTGGRFYNFSADSRTQLALFSNCEATHGRHSFVSNGASLASGIVFYRARATRGGGSEGGHRRWTQGVLYDNVNETEQGQILLINRGDFGTSHGWGVAHSTVWKYNSELLVQKPPTAQNYAITNAGHFREKVYFPGLIGHRESQSGELVPASLYEAQLCERLRGRGARPSRR